MHHRSFKKPDPVPGCLALVTSLRDAKQYSEALNKVQPLLKLPKTHPRYKQIQAQYACILRLNGQVDEGLVILKALCDDNIEDIKSANSLAVAYDQAGYPEKSIAFLESYIDRLSHDISEQGRRNLAIFYNAIAISYYNLTVPDIKKEKHYAILATGVDETYAAGWSTLAKVYRTYGDQDNSLKCFEKFDIARKLDEDRWNAIHGGAGAEAVPNVIVTPAKHDFTISAVSPVDEVKRSPVREKKSKAVKTMPSLSVDEKKTEKKKVLKFKPIVKRAPIKSLKGTTATMNNLFASLEIEESSELKMQALSPLASDTVAVPKSKSVVLPTIPSIAVHRREQSCGQLTVRRLAAAASGIGNGISSCLNSASFFRVKAATGIERGVNYLSMIPKMYSDCKRKKAHVKMINDRLTKTKAQDARIKNRRPFL
jgi:tetratricopeptide (TPR) repeat protein